MARGIREEQRTDSERGTRAERVPLGTNRQKLAMPEIPGYMTRWINDSEGRIQQALDGSYEFVYKDEIEGIYRKGNGNSVGVSDVGNVNRDLGSRFSRTVDRHSGQQAYLMKIRTELYEADQQAKLNAPGGPRDVENRIRSGKQTPVENGYVPDQGRAIKITTD